MQLTRLEIVTACCAQLSSPYQLLPLKSLKISLQSNRVPPPQANSLQTHTNTQNSTHNPRGQHPQPYFLGKSLNTRLKTSRLLYKFASLNLSLSKCAESLACPHGKCAAGASNSFSRNRIAGILPPSRM